MNRRTAASGSTLAEASTDGFVLLGAVSHHRTTRTRAANQWQPSPVQSHVICEGNVQYAERIFFGELCCIRLRLGNVSEEPNKSEEHHSRCGHTGNGGSQAQSQKNQGDYYETKYQNDRAVAPTPVEITYAPEKLARGRSGEKRPGLKAQPRRKSSSRAE